MINEVARALTDWFNDPLQGIAQRLATTVPREGTDPLPAIGTVADETRDNLVAQWKFPSVPGIAVNVRQIKLEDGDSETVQGDGIAEIVVCIARSEKDSKIAARDTSYILRAVLQSWRAFNRDTRTRNQIQIYNCPKLALAPAWDAKEDTITTGAVNGQLEFRDLTTF
jgi:hypothetical protein